MNGTVPGSRILVAGARLGDLLLVLLVGLALFLPGLGSRDLWNPDEPRYAEVAREMLNGGDFLVPRLNGEIYTQKPPLQFWLIALAGLARGGVDEVAARLPAALSGAGLLVVTFLLGHRLFNRRAAWLGALALGTCVKIFWQGRVGQIDMLLVFLVALAMWCWVRAYSEERPLWGKLFFVFTGLATLAKGPAGLLPPLLAILVFLALRKDRQGLGLLRPGTGLLLWAAVVLLWLAPAGLRGGGEYLEQILIRQNLTRYANPWHHQQPWYYYLTVIPGDFFPWSFLVPTALVVGWRRLRSRLAPGFWLLLCWVAVTIVFFSISPAKRTVYVLTMYPALALLVGAALDRVAASWPRERSWLLVPVGLVAAVWAAAAVALPLVARGRPELAALPASLPLELGLWLGCGAVGGLAALVTAIRGRPAAAPALLAAGSALALLGLVVGVLPEFDRFKSARPMSSLLTRVAQPGEPYGIYPRLDPTFLFYTGRHAENLDSSEKLVRFSRRPGRKWVLAERDDLEKLEVELPLVEVARDLDPVEGYVLLTDPPPPPLPDSLVWLEIAD